MLQWIAMLATLAASWLVTSKVKHKRMIGFWIFLVSNVLWIAWGSQNNAPALVVLQVCLGVVNIRGIWKASRDAAG